MTHSPSASTAWRAEQRLDGHSDAVTCVAVTKSGTQAVSGSRDGHDREVAEPDNRGRCMPPPPGDGALKTTDSGARWFDSTKDCQLESRVLAIAADGVYATIPSAW